MLISTPISVLKKNFGIHETLRILARAGFTAFDLTVFDIDEDNPLYNEGWQDYLDTILDVCRETGIVCNQAHAPFTSRKIEVPKNEWYNTRIQECIIRTIEAAGYLGAKVVVVHPITYKRYRDHKEFMDEKNFEFFRSLGPHAHKAGVKIGVENMLQVDDDGKIIVAPCSDPDDFCRYIDTLGEDFTACLDIGHCALNGPRPAQMIHALGADRLGALHVHDNDGKRDIHQLPYHMAIDWDEILDALADVGYRGDFTLEADTFYGRLPKELLEDAAGHMAKVSHHMVNHILTRRGETT